MRAAITLAAVGTAATALSLVSASHHDNAAAHFGAARRHHAKAQQLEFEQRAVAAAVPATESELALEKRGSYSGQATWYIVNTGNQGSCGGFLNPWEHTVALNQPMYGDLNSRSSWCNKKIVISANGKQTTATIRDACPESDETCHYGSLDMSVSLFTFFNPQSVGVFDIKWWPAGESDPTGPTPAEKAAAKAAAAKKAAAAAAAAAAERKKESIASKKSKSIASVKSVKSVHSSKTHYSHTKSVASVKSVSSASVKSVKSVASVASKSAKSASAAAAKQSAYDLKHKPHNVKNLQSFKNGLSDMVKQAKV